MSCNDKRDVAEQKENVVRMIRNTAIGTKMFDSEISSTIDKADDTYRWYLCTQTAPAGWDCERKNAYEILGAAAEHHVDKTTTMIPVNKFIPSLFDNMIIRHNIRSMTHVKVVK